MNLFRRPKPAAQVGSKEPNITRRAFLKGAAAGAAGAGVIGAAVRYGPGLVRKAKEARDAEEAEKAGTAVDKHLTGLKRSEKQRQIFGQMWKTEYEKLRTQVKATFRDSKAEPTKEQVEELRERLMHEADVQASIEAERKLYGR